MKIAMKIALFRYTFLALGAMTLLAGPVLIVPASAQDAPAPGAITTPISLDLQQVSVQSALTALFKSASIRNYRIVGEPQGFVNLSVSEVPFSVALQQLLNSANPPLVADVQNGIYTISARPTAVPPPRTVATALAPAPVTSTSISDPNAPKHFYKIPINKYDAYYIASLLQATSGVIPVGINDVVASGGGQGGFGQGQQAGQGQNGRQGGFGQGGQGGRQGGGRGGFGGNTGGFGGTAGGFGGGTSFGGGFGGGGNTGVVGASPGGFAAPF